MVCWHYFFKLRVSATTNLQSLVYLCLVISSCVKKRRKFPCGNSLFRFHTSMYYLHRTISTWLKYDKSIGAYIHCIRTKSIQAPGYPPFLTLNHPPNLEASNFLTKIIFSPKIAHSLIPSYRTFFRTSACGMLVFPIATN